MDNASESTVPEIIAEYESLSEQGNNSAARSILEKLEQDRFLNWEDWKRILDFLTKYNLVARLEIVTKRMIKVAPPESAKPYFLLIKLLIKSGRLAEAYSFLEESRNRFGDTKEYRWDIVNALFDTGQYQKCLNEVRRTRRQDPEGVGYAFLEIKTLIKLGERRSAKANFKQLPLLLKNNPEHWIWYLYLALELKDTAAVVNAEKSIVQLVEDGKAKVVHGMLFAFIHAGLKGSAARIIKYADPANFGSVSDARYVFELASSLGDFATSRKFGSAILMRDPNNDLRPNIEKLIAGKGFLIT